VPVVEPDMGAFCELVGETGGGLLYEPGNAQNLAEHLEVLLCDPQRAVDMGQRGRDAVCKQHNIARTAERMVEVFDKVAKRYR
jgi:glycosyltransferase involved in cell wall biosynthesis